MPFCLLSMMFGIAEFKCFPIHSKSFFVLLAELSNSLYYWRRLDVPEELLKFLWSSIVLGSIAFLFQYSISYYWLKAKETGLRLNYWLQNLQIICRCCCSSCVGRSGYMWSSQAWHPLQLFVFRTTCRRQYTHLLSSACNRSYAFSTSSVTSAMDANSSPRSRSGRLAA